MMYAQIFLALMTHSPLLQPYPSLKNSYRSSNQCWHDPQNTLDVRASRNVSSTSKTTYRP